MIKSRENILEQLAGYDLAFDTGNDPSAPTAYAINKAARILCEVSKLTDIPESTQTSDDDGGFFISWDTVTASVSLHIFGTPKGGFTKKWDENDESFQLVPTQDYIYYDFTDQSGEISLECGAEEDLRPENITKYLERFKESL